MAIPLGNRGVSKGNTGETDGTSAPDSADGESEALPRRKVGREDPVLCVVQGAVTNRSEDFAKDEDGVAVEVVRRSAGHDHGTAEMEPSQDDRHDSTAEFVDGEPESNA